MWFCAGQSLSAVGAGLSPLRSGQVKGSVEGEKLGNDSHMFLDD